MNRIFCRSCGTQVESAAHFCPGCGADQRDVQVVAADHGTADAQVSKLWLRRFVLIEKAGGPALPNVRTLPFRELWAINSNLLAFLFGPIYYIAKGMWKKGITLFIVVVVCLGVVEALLVEMGWNTNFLLFVGPAIFSRFANVTYYRLVKERRNAWW